MKPVDMFQLGGDIKATMVHWFQQQQQQFSVKVMLVNMSMGRDACLTVHGDYFNSLCSCQNSS
jgi:hypothetical protein